MATKRRKQEQKNGKLREDKPLVDLLPPLMFQVETAMKYARSQFHPDDNTWQAFCQEEIRESYNELRQALDHLDGAYGAANRVFQNGDGPAL